MWFFTYIKNENNDVVVFDMKNNNDNRGQTFNTNRNRGSAPQQQQFVTDSRHRKHSLLIEYIIRGVIENIHKKQKIRRSTAETIVRNYIK